MLHIILAVVAAMAIGGFWFSPAGFGKAWMKEMGFTQKRMKAMQKEGVGKYYAMAAAQTVVIVFVLSVFVKGMPLNIAMQTAASIWLGFMAPILYGEVIWGGRSCKLFVINASYWLVVMIVMSAIIVSL